MKSIWFILIFSLVVSTALAQSINVKVSTLKYDPSPAEPGKFLDLWLSIDNKGTGIVQNYVVELVPGYPFFLDSNENATRKFDSIDADGARMKYRIRVAEDAPDGDSILKVKHYQEGSSTFITEDLKISILGKINVDISSIEPDTLIPGNPTKVKFLFNNTGMAPVRDLIITWSDPNNKILPLGGENRFRIDELGVGASRTVEFRMIADPSITQGVHVININMSFQRFGQADSRTSQIAFIVGGLTDFDVAQQEINSNSLSVSVANIGVNTATGVMISIPDQPGWKVIGSSNVFLGNLNPGDFTVASVQIQPLSKEINKIDAKIEYTDTTGVRQSLSKQLSINQAQITAQKVEPRPNYLLYGIAAIVIIAILWYLKKRIRKKR